MDTVQDVFVYLARKFPGLELRAGMTTFFLYPAVKHTAPAIRRKRCRISGLAETRWVLLMRFVDDLSLEEIAAALAVRVGTVKKPAASCDSEVAGGTAVAAVF